MSCAILTIYKAKQCHRNFDNLQC